MYNIIQADIWCENDVVLTLMRRDYVASTLIQRHLAQMPAGIIPVAEVHLAIIYQ